MGVTKVFLICVAVSMTSAAYADVTVDFPLASDTWEVLYDPYWWQIGDTVYGDRDLGTEEFDYVWVTLPITYNSLTDYGGGHGEVDLDLQLDSSTEFSFVVDETSGTGNVVFEGAISYVPTGTEEVRYYETNLVDLYCGSIQIGNTNGTIQFQTVASGIESASLGEIKAVFK